MGYDGKYGQITTEFGDVPADEPVIVFRARDRLTTKLIGIYWNLCKEAGSPQRHLDIINATHDRFEAWQDAHEDQVRTPDSERSRLWLGEFTSVDDAQGSH